MAMASASTNEAEMKVKVMSSPASAVRKVYIVTYSQADTENFSRETFASAIVEAFVALSCSYDYSVGLQYRETQSWLRSFSHLLNFFEAAAMEEGKEIHPR